MRRKTQITAGLLLLLILATAGCSSWEQRTFQSLSASKAVLDQAQVDYEAGKIPHTQQSYLLITKAKQAQSTAIDAFFTYENIKTAKGSASALQAQQAIVAAALAQVPALLADIKALYGGKQ